MAHDNTKQLKQQAIAIEAADQDDPLEIEFCPVCMGEASIIGGLGFKEYYSCRYCGYVFGRDHA